MSDIMKSFTSHSVILVIGFVLLAVIMYYFYSKKSSKQPYSSCSTCSATENFDVLTSETCKLCSSKLSRYCKDFKPFSPTNSLFVTCLDKFTSENAMCKNIADQMMAGNDVCNLKSANV